MNQPLWRKRQCQATTCNAVRGTLSELRKLVALQTCLLSFTTHPPLVHCAPLSVIALSFFVLHTAICPRPPLLTV